MHVAVLKTHFLYVYSKYSGDKHLETGGPPEGPFLVELSTMFIQIITEFVCAFKYLNISRCSHAGGFWNL